MERTYNPIKMILDMSPDRKMAWFLVLTGVVKILGLDAWIPLPDDPDQAVQVITHANEEVRALVEQLRQETAKGDDTLISMLLTMGGVAYVVLKKVKEIFALKRKAPLGE